MASSEKAPAAAAPAVENHADVLEEDDEFEEFEVQEWNAAEEDVEDPTMWQDGWEDDEDDDQFTKQLRAELDASEAAAGGAAKTAGAGAQAMQE